MEERTRMSIHTRPVFLFLLMGAGFLLPPYCHAAQEPVKSPLSERIRQTFQKVRESPPPPPFSEKAAQPVTGAAISMSDGFQAVAGADFCFFPFGSGVQNLTDLFGQGKGAAGPGNGLAFSTWGKYLLCLDSVEGKILGLSQGSPQPEVFLKDTMGRIHMVDFARMAGQTVALADNSRKAVFLFNNQRFQKVLGLLEDRFLFQFIRHLFANEDGTQLGVSDSAKSRSYVFDLAGNLLWETAGAVEPAFYGGGLVALRKQESEVLVDVVNSFGARNLFLYQAAPGNIVLDAWVAGTRGKVLVLVVSEGRGNEDLPDVTKVIVYDPGKIKNLAIPHMADHEVAFRRPYVLAGVGNALFLLTPDLREDGLAFKSFSLLP